MKTKSLLFKFLILWLLFLPVSCAAKTTILTATWTQRIQDVSRTDFGGWEIYVSDSENGTYLLWATVPFSGAKENYSLQKNMTVNKNVTKWFKALAYNKNGEKGPFSNTSFVTLTGNKKNPVIFKILLEEEK